MVATGKPGASALWEATTDQDGWLTGGLTAMAKMNHAALHIELVPGGHPRSRQTVRSTDKTPIGTASPEASSPAATHRLSGSLRSVPIAMQLPALIVSVR